ncbi:MAG: hypothetical protein ACE5H3_01035 [Planctomycetota bacterium]
MRIPLLAAAAAVLLSAPLFSQRSDWTQLSQNPGQARGDLLGSSIAPVGDLDGDGVPDILAGAPGADINGRNSGAVEVLSGASGALLYTVAGQVGGSLFGFAVAGLGDLDGDNRADFAVSSAFFSSGPGGLFAGRVYVFSGADGTLLDTLDGFSQGEVFGSSLAGVDHDGDGVRELVVGVMGAGTTQEGEVRIFRWAVNAMVLDATVAGATAGEGFGFSAARVGDRGTGGPGEEFAAGAPFAGVALPEAGRVDLIENGVSVISEDGPTQGGHLGVSVTGGFDVDGTGQPDFAAGSPDTVTGDVLVFRGEDGSLLTQVGGAAAGDQFGYAVALTGDANFDGLAELLAGSPGSDSFKGMIQVLDLNGATGTEELLAVTGTKKSHMGYSVASAGDLDGDGNDDIAFGTPVFKQGTTRRAGKVESWLSPETSLPPVVITVDPLTLGETSTVRATNLIPGSQVTFLVGDTNAPGVFNGVNVDITDIHTPALGTKKANANGNANLTFDVPCRMVDGTTPSEDQTLFFQVIEDSGANTRISNVAAKVVQRGVFTIDFVGTWKVGKTVQLNTVHGNTTDPANLTYFYFSLQGTGNDKAPDGSWNTGLKNPSAWSGSPNTTDDCGAAKSRQIRIPASAGGRKIFLQAFSFHTNSAKWVLSNVLGPINIQP